MSYKKKSDNPPILLHMDWGDMLLKLNDADVGYIIKGMLLHRLGKECESREVDPILEGVLSVMNAQSDREAKSYVERCEKNAEVARLRKNGKRSLTNVNDSQPTLTNVNNNNNNYNNNYSNNNNYNDNNNNNINTSFSSNEEKGVEKETEKEDVCPDAVADGSVDPSEERGNPNFDLRKSYAAIKKRKTENWLKTGEYI